MQDVRATNWNKYELLALINLSQIYLLNAFILFQTTTIVSKHLNLFDAVPVTAGRTMDARLIG